MNPIVSVKRTLCAAIAVLAFGAVATASAQQPITLRIGHNTPVGTPTDVAVKHFGKLVAERSGGKIVIKDYPAGQIGNEQQMIEGLQTGTIDMAGIIGATFGNVVPEYSVLGVLYTAFQLLYPNAVPSSFSPSSSEHFCSTFMSRPVLVAQSAALSGIFS